MSAQDWPSSWRRLWGSPTLRPTIQAGDCRDKATAQRRRRENVERCSHDSRSRSRPNVYQYQGQRICVRMCILLLYPYESRMLWNQQHRRITVGSHIFFVRVAMRVPETSTAAQHLLGCRQTTMSHNRVTSSDRRDRITNCTVRTTHLRRIYMPLWGAS